MSAEARREIGELLLEHLPCDCVGCERARDDRDSALARCDDLEAERDRARAIAVELEQQNAELNREVRVIFSRLMNTRDVAVRATGQGNHIDGVSVVKVPDVLAALDGKT